MGREQYSSDLCKMNMMVENFQHLCYGRFESTRMACSQNRTFTKFTVDEILKPNFRRQLQVDANEYDSDGTSCSDSNCDSYSSCDESNEYYDSNATNALALTQSSDIRMFCDSSIADNNFQSQNALQFGWKRTDEEGDVSSDSETALDLRIARKKTPPKVTNQLPAWVFCTRYSDRPSAGPRSRKRKTGTVAQRKNRTNFNDFQLHQLNLEFARDQYLGEERRARLARDLNLEEASIKVWFQNRRAKVKKESAPQPLAERLQHEGLYNHKAAVC